MEKIYEYNQNPKYSPLRKSDLRCPQNSTPQETSKHEVKTREKICLSIKMALNVKKDKLMELSKNIGLEKGVETAADVISSLSEEA